MAQGERKNWRELCKAALGAKDPDELLKILQDLNQVVVGNQRALVLRPTFLLQLTSTTMRSF
jgi:hypothetical protein